MPCSQHLVLFLKSGTQALRCRDMEVAEVTGKCPVTNDSYLFFFFERSVSRSWWEGTQESHNSTALTQRPGPKPFPVCTEGRTRGEKGDGSGFNPCV